VKGLGINGDSAAGRTLDAIIDGNGPQGAGNNVTLPPYLAKPYSDALLGVRTFNSYDEVAARVIIEGH